MFKTIFGVCLTPLHTCKRTRAGLKGISTCFGELFSQSIIFSTSSFLTWKLSQLRIADSRRILIEYGNLSVIHIRVSIIILSITMNKNHYFTIYKIFFLYIIDTHKIIWYIKTKKFLLKVVERKNYQSLDRSKMGGCRTFQTRRLLAWEDLSSLP